MIPPLPMRQRPLAIVTAALLLLLAQPALAWSTKEHILLTRFAIARLLADDQTPPQMKQWLRHASPGELDMDALADFYLHTRQGIIPRNVDGLPYWSVVPDLQALISRPRDVVSPFDVHERILHYLDVEYFDPDQQQRAEDQKPIYKPDLSARPRLADFPRDHTDARYRQAGMLPFRIEQSYNRLTASLRAGRLNDQPGRFPRDDHAAKWAGYLAHYVADNTQPHHSTVDYRSRSYFPEPGRAPGVHAQVEYMLVDDGHDDYLETRKRVWELFIRKLETVEDPVSIADVWAGSVRTSLDAYDALPLIGQAARAAWRPDTPSTRSWEHGIIDTPAFYAHSATWRDTPTTLAEVKAHQMALAVKRIAAHWRQAWDAAHPDD